MQYIHPWVSLFTKVTWGPSDLLLPPAACWVWARGWPRPLCPSSWGCQSCWCVCPAPPHDPPIAGASCRGPRTPWRSRGPPGSCPVDDEQRLVVYVIAGVWRWTHTVTRVKTSIWRTLIFWFSVCRAVSSSRTAVLSWGESGPKLCPTTSISS